MSIRKFKHILPVIGKNTFIDPSAQVIGKVTIGDNSSVWSNVTIRGDVNHITIGNETSIQDNSCLHVTHDHPDGSREGFPLSIGDQVTIGHGVILHGCVIENRCLIGMGTCIMDGAFVEDDVLIAAGSLIPPGKILKSGYLWIGRPAIAIRELTEEEYHRLKYSAKHYVRLKEEYLNSNV